MWELQQLAFYLQVMPFLTQILFPMFAASAVLLSVSHLAIDWVAPDPPTPVVIVANEANL